MKAFVIDDSALFRNGISAALTEIPEIELLGVASNGKEALQVLENLTPDLVIVDLEMPVMDGLSFIKHFRMSNNNAYVLVFSSHTRRGAQLTIEALLAGANDFLSKTEINQGESDPISALIKHLEPRIMQFKHLPDQKRQQPSLSTAQNPCGLTKIEDHFRPDLVLIGCSTGGPQALQSIFNDLSLNDKTPILIVQHMPAMFTKELARMLDKTSAWLVKEAEDGEIILGGHAYIAPGDFHMRIAKSAAGFSLSMSQDEKVNYVRPAVDVLFSSVAQTFTGQVLALVLTGMGEDGLKGTRDLLRKQTRILIQDKNSSVVWGMPGALFRNELFDEMHSLSELPEKISTYLSIKPSTARSAV